MCFHATLVIFTKAEEIVPPKANTQRASPKCAGRSAQTRGHRQGHVRSGSDPRETTQPTDGCLVVTARGTDIVLTANSTACDMDAHVGRKEVTFLHLAQGNRSAHFSEGNSVAKVGAALCLTLTARLRGPAGTPVASKEPHRFLPRP